jgi:hypothetical protein
MGFRLKSSNVHVLARLASQRIVGASSVPSIQLGRAIFETKTQLVAVE